MEIPYAIIFIPLILALVGLYLLHINAAINGTPEDALKLSPNRWTEDEIKETYQRICEKPISSTEHLPPKLGRRYIVTGSSGLVGGTIVLQLLARGESPESIRMVDLRGSVWHHKENDAVTKCEWIKTDISSMSSVKAAFESPWPSSVALAPMTVFHTAAVIRPQERSKLFYHRCSKVNVDGTANIIAAAKAAGADILVATSSGSIALRPVQMWIAPWTKFPGRFFQLYDESDAYSPERPHEDFFANYAVSKARAERLVMKANGTTLKTGCLRPASGVYGNEHDHNIATYISVVEIPTWVEHIFQNFVHAENISLAHLLFEKALLSSHSSKVAGRSFLITDPNPAITFGDSYALVKTLKVAPSRIIRLPPVLMLLVAYCIESYCLILARFPSLRTIFPEPEASEASYMNLQPSLFTICTHIIANDAEARKPMDEGGLGYKAIWTTLEGMCNEVRLWNEKYASKASQDQTRPANGVNGLVAEIRNSGTVPASVKA